MPRIKSTVYLSVDAYVDVEIDCPPAEDGATYDDLLTYEAMEKARPVLRLLDDFEIREVDIYCMEGLD